MLSISWSNEDYDYDCDNDDDDDHCDDDDDCAACDDEDAYNMFASLAGRVHLIVSVLFVCGLFF